MLQRDFLKARRKSSSLPPDTGFVVPAPNKRQRPPSGRPLSSVVINHSINPSTSSSLGGCFNRLYRGSSSTSSMLSSSTPAIPVGGLGGEKVQVAVRCRPPNSDQGESSDNVIVSMDPSKGDIYLVEQERPWRVDTPVWSGRGPAMDHSPPVSQSALYERIGRPILLHALDGYNSTLMAYGQTGSGKTYTMIGGDSATEAGVIPRVCEDIFSELQNRSFTAASGETISWEVHVRYVEIYCERISDLLNSGAMVSFREEVTARSAAFNLIGARRVKAESKEDLLQALSIGNRWRRTAATKTNERSSRSHAIYMIELTELLSFEEPDGTVVSAPSKSLTLRLVDLAGSERVSETGVQGQHLKEARDINLSLFTLGQVIECLSDPKRRHIKPPYRDSVLTKLLRDAFGGNSKTTIVCTVAPCEQYRSQTLQTLNYAAKARRVLNRPRVEEDPSALELRRANEELLTLRRELSEAHRSGRHVSDIEQQLQQANERLHREQAEARQRREAMERREADLACRLQHLENQREAYEAHMAAVESEAERARAQQSKREDDLRRVHHLAEESAQRRMKELHEHQAKTEQALRAKEDELLHRQRAVEVKLRDLETKSQRRVEELLSEQRDLEAVLRERERLALGQEQDLRTKQKAAEEAVHQMEMRSKAMEEEWASQLQAMERDAERREAELAKRAEDAQARLRSAEDEAKEKEELMRRKWTEAEQQSRSLQMAMEMKQADLDRRVRDLSFQAQERENALNGKLQQAEYELRCRERDSERHLHEVETLRVAAARQSETARTKERDLETQNNLLLECLRTREDILHRREEDLSKQMGEVSAMRADWERKQSENLEALQAEHAEAMAALQAREKAFQLQEIQALQAQDKLEMKLRAQEMELKRSELALLAQRNDLGAEAQRERHMNLRAREEMQHALDQAEAENKLREDRLQRWEIELRTRRQQTDREMAESQQSLAAREAALTSAEDTMVTRTMEIEQAAHKLQMEQAELRARLETEDRARHCAHKEALAELERQQRDMAARHTSMQSMEEELQHKMQTIREDDTPWRLELAKRSLFQRELYNFISFESLYRGSIISEEESEYRFLFKFHRMEGRDVVRAHDAAEHYLRYQLAEAEMRTLTEERNAAHTANIELQQQINDLRGELRERQEAEMELRVQLGSATSLAQRAEESFHALAQERESAESALREALHSRDTELDAAKRVLVEAGDCQRSAAALTTHLLCVFEERERSLLENQSTGETLFLHLLESSHRKSLDKDRSVERWKQLCEQRVAPDPLSTLRQRQVKEEARRLSSFTRMEGELKLREESLLADQSALQCRVDDFEARERVREDALAQQEEKIKVYLLELEDLDVQRAATVKEQEEKLLAACIRLREKERELHAQLIASQIHLLQENAMQQRRLCEAQETIERNSLLRTVELRLERFLAVRGLGGDAVSITDLLRRQEGALLTEAEYLAECMRQHDEEESRRQFRFAEEEEQVRQSLLALEAEDIRRSELSKQGQAYLQEAEERLEQARRKEAELEDWGRRLQLEAITAEDKVKEVEANIRRQERLQRTLMSERAAALGRQQEDADATAAANETKLQALNMELRETLQRNKGAEQAIQARDAEIKRQKLYYKDLTRMLEERDAIIKKEHRHRMNGKRSAVGLADDLLEANDELKKKLTIIKRKYDVLRVEGRLECERCSWLNVRDAAMCRCCGNDEIVEASA